MIARDDMALGEGWRGKGTRGRPIARPTMSRAQMVHTCKVHALAQLTKLSSGHTECWKVVWE